ncbi:MAG: DUF4168 domain-containing protein [Oscillatoria sp. SIO1A7]|nr:DUF4168 domain-containing protein [Oscillatoria sp. SIO1A7]
MTIANNSRLTLKKMLWRSLLAGAISVLGVLAGVTPNLEGRSLFIENNCAYAQSIITDEEIANYAQSVLEIEPLRQQLYNEIKKIVGTPPPVVCNDPSTSDLLTGDARDIADSYCEESKAIVEKNELSIRRFNEITETMENNPDIQLRIVQEIMRKQEIMN